MGWGGDVSQLLLLQKMDIRHEIRTYRKFDENGKNGNGVEEKERSENIYVFVRKNDSTLEEAEERGAAAGRQHTSGRSAKDEGRRDAFEPSITIRTDTIRSNLCRFPEFWEDKLIFLLIADLIHQPNFPRSSSE